MSRLGRLGNVFKETVVLGSGGHIYCAAGALSLAQLGSMDGPAELALIVSLILRPVELFHHLLHATLIEAAVSSR